MQRIAEKRHTAADLALVKSVPEIARYVPDPSGPQVAVTTTRTTGPTTDALETCGPSTVDLMQPSILGAVIYKWRHQVQWCDDKVNVTRITGRYDQLLQIDSLGRYLELTGDIVGATPRVWTTSYYQRHIEWCTPSFPVGSFCYHMYPWSRIYMHNNSRWRYEYGDAAG